MPAQRNAQLLNNTSLEVIAAVMLKAQVFRDVTACRLVNIDRRFERAYPFETSIKFISLFTAASQNTSITRINVNIFGSSFIMPIIIGCELEY